MHNSMMETEIPYFEIEITKESSPFAIALAKHLHSVGAKLYGAFWCSHCLDQKEVLSFLFHFQPIHIACQQEKILFFVFEDGFAKISYASIAALHLGF